MIYKCLGTKIVALHEGLINDIDNRTANKMNTFCIIGCTSKRDCPYFNTRRIEFLGKKGKEEIGRLVHVYLLLVALGTVASDSDEVTVLEPITKDCQLTEGGVAATRFVHNGIERGLGRYSIMRSLAL